MTEPLSYSHVLTHLIHCINATDKPANIGWDEVAQWQAGVLTLFVEAGLLVNSNQAQSLECKGCEHRCYMPVEFTDDKQRAFIVCDHPEMQSHMGPIPVPLARLEQWQTSPILFAKVIADLLDFESAPNYKKANATYELGMLPGSGGRRWVFLTVNPLAIVINQQCITVNELLYIEQETLHIDRLRIDELLNQPANRDKPYTPNTDRRETRKLATQAMYQGWKDKRKELKKTHPNAKDTWIAMKISKLSIAQGRDAGTIRKNMK